MTTTRFRGWLLLAGMAWSACSSALSAADNFPIPNRPAVARAAYKGQMLPVVAVRGKTPLVEANGKRVPASRPTQFSLDVGYEFAPGNVELQDPEAIGWSVEFSVDSTPLFDAPKLSQFRARLVADTDLDDVFIVVLVFEHLDTFDQPVECGVVSAEVGKLRANEPRFFSTTFPPVGGRKRWAWSVAVFSGPRQVRSHGVSNLLPHFFDAVERHRYGLKSAERAQGPDAPMHVFRQIPFQFPESLQTRYAGQLVIVRLHIDSDGELLDVALKDHTDHELLGEVRRRLNAWMFLPTIKDGRPVSDYANLPIRF